MSIQIHPSADVSEQASIGDGSMIWHNVHIRETAVIGKDCNIGKNVYIDKDVTIGSRVKIQNNVNIYHGVTVEDDVFLGPSMTFTNDMYPRAFSEDWEVSPTLVKKGASIGANCTVLCGIRIGEYALAGAGSTVTKDVLSHALVVGNPARQIGWVCRCGFRLNDSGECTKCGRKYSFDSENRLIPESDLSR